MLSVLRRKSSRSSGRYFHVESSQLLADVQQCCSKLGQMGVVPDEASVNRAIATLQDTEDRDVLDGVLRYLGGELKSDTHKVKMLTLSTIGFLMRADHAYFQRMLCTTGYVLKQMALLADQRRKNSSTTSMKQEPLDEADLALQLIQCWAETIQGENDTQEILTLYDDLKRKEWIKWPPRNHLYDCDVQVVRREVSVDFTAPPPPRKPVSLRPSSLRTFSSEDTEWMRKDFDQFDVLLTSLQTELKRCHDSQDLEENALVPELVVECNKIGPQLRSMIEIVSHTSREDPAALQPLLDMNDRLLRVIEHHKRLQQTPPAKKKDQEYNPFDDEALLTQVFSQMGGPPKPPAPTNSLDLMANQDIFSAPPPPAPPVSVQYENQSASTSPRSASFASLLPPPRPRAVQQQQQPKRPPPTRPAPAQQFQQQQRYAASPPSSQPNPFADDDLL